MAFNDGKTHENILDASDIDKMIAHIDSGKLVSDELKRKFAYITNKLNCNENVPNLARKERFPKRVVFVMRARLIRLAIATVIKVSRNNREVRLIAVRIGCLVRVRMIMNLSIMNLMVIKLNDILVGKSLNLTVISRSQL